MDNDIWTACHGAGTMATRAGVTDPDRPIPRNCCPGSSSRCTRCSARTPCTSTPPSRLRYDRRDGHEPAQFRAARLPRRPLPGAVLPGSERPAEAPHRARGMGHAQAARRQSMSLWALSHGMSSRIGTTPWTRRAVEDAAHEAGMNDPAPIFDTLLELGVVVELGDPMEFAKRYRMQSLMVGWATRPTIRCTAASGCRASRPPWSCRWRVPAVGVGPPRKQPLAVLRTAGGRRPGDAACVPRGSRPRIRPRPCDRRPAHADRAQRRLPRHGSHAPRRLIAYRPAHRRRSSASFVAGAPAGETDCRERS